MEFTRLSAKERIVLPKSICISHAWGPGTTSTVKDTGDGILLHRANRLDEVVGGLRFKGRPKTPAQMRNAVEGEIIRRR